MAESSAWAFPDALQPQPGDVAFDVEAVAASVVRVRAAIPDDAFTAPVLGTEREGNGVVIRDDGLVLTIGYLVAEAATTWLTTRRGDVVPAHPLIYDYASGFGLVHPLGHLEAPPIVLGQPARVGVGDDVCVIGFGGRRHALKARIFAKREFAGYWEYVLDEAFFTTPAHPEWSGAALVDSKGHLIGVGSLFVQEQQDDEPMQGNMFVPIDLLDPLLEGLRGGGQSPRKPRPWLGMYTGDANEGLVVNGVAVNAPADAAGIEPGDVVVGVGGEPVHGLADLFRRIWRTGPAGCDIALTLLRKGTRLEVNVHSASREEFLKKPTLQ
ncbi:MAG TPA: S1C family serine protease [Casimicrobiaceae bacterium]|jgi:S1-C subfamily serine protease|nr:S1C family serine protease [Casimicrobiaceae bacterium]